MTNNFGNNLRMLRTGIGMTQESLADFLCVSFQTVSKWERGETVPDIFMLPVIASVFNVTTDYLLGFNQELKESSVNQYTADYYRLWNEEKYEDALRLMKTAVSSYPAEYSLLVRYLNVLTWCARSNEVRALSALNEANAVFNRINSYCTVDSIRIWAKKIMCQYYLYLSDISGSGIQEDDIKVILAELPLMQNCRDYLECKFEKDPDKIAKACKKTVSELIYLLCNTVYTLCSCETGICNTDKIDILTAFLTSFERIFNDRDYGKSSVKIAQLMILLSNMYQQEGNISQSDEWRNKGKSTIESFNKSDDQLIHTSPLLRDLEVAKCRIPMSGENELNKILQ
ncbi:MAG: helix-turn-helix domain-containing protein [Candidatus Avispirillum sp.]